MAAAKKTKSNPKRWSADVMKKSDAMDLGPGVFTQRSARAVARSLKKIRRGQPSPQINSIQVGNVHAQFRDQSRREQAQRRAPASIERSQS